MQSLRCGHFPHTRLTHNNHNNWRRLDVIFEWKKTVFLFSGENWIDRLNQSMPLCGKIDNWRHRPECWCCFGWEVCLYLRENFLSTAKSINLIWFHPVATAAQLLPYPLSVSVPIELVSIDFSDKNIFIKIQIKIDRFSAHTHTHASHSANDNNRIGKSCSSWKEKNAKKTPTQCLQRLQPTSTATATSTKKTE